jgi:hypothetical protein
MYMYDRVGRFGVRFLRLHLQNLNYLLLDGFFYKQREYVSLLSEKKEGSLPWYFVI